MMGILGAMRSEAGRTHVDQIEDHNRRAAERRAGRSDVLVSMVRQAEPGRFAELLHDRHAMLFEHYRDLRIRRAARNLANRFHPVPGWSYERVLRAVETAQRQMDTADQPEQPRLPYLPDGPAWQIDPHGRAWAWGVTTAENLSDDALDLVRHLSWHLAELPKPPQALRDKLEEARGAINLARAELHHNRADFDRQWSTPERQAPQPNVSYWRQRLDTYRAAYCRHSG